MSVLRRLRTLALAGPRRQGLLGEAVASLLVARLWLAWSPFGQVAGRLGAFVPPGDRRVVERSARGSSRDVAAARSIGWAVRAVAPTMPFKAVCLQQAIAAHAMLRRRGIASVVHFGAMREGEQLLDAHAWVDAAGIAVTGYPLDPKMTELGCLV